MPNVKTGGKYSAEVSLKGKRGAILSVANDKTLQPEKGTGSSSTAKEYKGITTAMNTDYQSVKGKSKKPV